MGETTGIDWCDATFNPWMGCANVSAGCGHCYAKTLTSGRMGLDIWADSPRQITAPSNWQKPLRWARLAREGKLPDGRPNEDGHRPRVFCASLADVFEELPQLDDPTMRHWRGNYPTAPRAAVMDLIVDTPELDWLLLTKRPEFARDWLRDYYGDDWKPYEPETDEGIFPNLWLGTSIENARFTWRADVLREIPAAVHFISAEPLLGSLYDSRPLSKSVPAGPTVGDDATEGSTDTRGRAPLDLTHIEWVIIGGESGPGHRPMNVEHAREIRDACLHHGEVEVGLVDLETGEESTTPFPTTLTRPALFFKQHGGPTPKAGGKLLDGREWCEFPETTHSGMTGQEALFA